MAAFVAAGLSLIGVPLTVGFISKWFLVLGALEQGLWIVAVLILGGSLVAVVYIWKVVEAAYFQDYMGELQVREAPLSLLLPMWTLVVANFLFGFHASFTYGVARQAAQVLLRVGP
jgi:multicomponent Na+:H+ antiporter subunit D